MDFLKNIWKGVVSVIGILAVVTALVTFDARYAKPADIKMLKVEVAATLEEVKKSFQLDRDIQRMNNVTDRLMDTRQRLLQYPKDKGLKEDIENLTIEKKRLQNKLEGEK